MTDGDLDQAYTALCEALSAAGEARALPLLSRVALLALLEIDDPATVERLIARAVRSLADPLGPNADHDGPA